MKTNKLYVCGTAWDYERDTTNGGQLEFYTTKKALKADRKCWKECGIVEVTPESSKYVINPIPASKRQGISAKELQLQEEVYIPLANELVALSNMAGNSELAESALTWALATVKRKNRKANEKKRRI